ncbi:FIGfam138462: Acyl-CoA synthetase, AMP-(fatty) acid ligase [hydrothermal vent metagenome]|uniref:FIGfam138462: Acyl-CoA synthetase, AMP-(Fatty) acid ligase n=1 Tax=hydrothermal vent metagenome TaxID=652676 RepID=A0A3B0W480_9ZZZZ
MLSYLLDNEKFSELFSLWQSTPFIYFGLNSEKPSLTRWEIFQVAEQLSHQLPKNDFSVILLFQQRHHFLIGLLATALKNGRCILPPNLADITLNNLAKQHPNAYVMAEHCPQRLKKQMFITDKAITQLIHKVQAKPTPFSKKALTAYLNTIQNAEIWLFTSGTTATPKQVIKTWKNMMLSAEIAIKRFQLMQSHYIVATVPSQHMFGLETTIFWPLFSASCQWFDRPIFPEDILEALNANTQHPTYLISTPLHLQKILEFKLYWPYHLSYVLSATAPLSLKYAQKIEASFNVNVFEIYGSTETASIASRQTTQSKYWQAYEEVVFQTHQNQILVKTPGLVSFQHLNDQIEQIDCSHFILGQRDADLIKVSGKRASLTELNQCLQNIPNVSEGIFLPSKNSERLMAFVVSSLPAVEILAALRESIDPVFLPRPLHFIEVLPRNDIGKIMYNQLLSKIK